MSAAKKASARTTTGAQLVLMAGVLALFALQWLALKHYTNDDAYITFRYSRNLIEGRGPYFNVGEHVEGYTNFLQMILAAIVLKVVGVAHMPEVVKFLGVLWGAGAAILAFVTCRALLASAGLPSQALLLSPIAAGIVAVSPGFAVNSTSGLETSLFAFLLALGTLLALREDEDGRSRRSWIAFGLALLTRPEGSMLFAAHWLARAGALVATHVSDGGKVAALARSPRSRMLVTCGAATTLVFLAHVAFRYVAYDGELLPNTYYAKLGGYEAMPPWGYLKMGLFRPVFGAIGLLVAAAGLVLGARPIVGRLLPVAAIAVTGAALPFVSGTDWMMGYRLLMPYLPALAVVVALGWSLLLARSGRWLRPWAAAAVVVACVGALWLTQDEYRERVARETAVRARGYVTGHGEVARWLGARARTGDTVALMDIGIIGYRCIGQSILDVSGLTDRAIARAPGKFLQKDYDPVLVFGRKPEFLVLAITVPGDPSRPPAPGTALVPLTHMEDLLAHDAEFAHYARPRQPESAQGDWLAQGAAGLGAERLFPHAESGRHYLLGVYARDEVIARPGYAR